MRVGIPGMKMVGRGLQRIMWSFSSAIGWSLTFVVVLFSAFAFYTGFYFLYVPSPLHIKPVHFKFPTHGFILSEGKHAERSDDLYHLRKVVNHHHSDFHNGNSNQFPTAVLSLRSPDQDPKSVGDRILSRGQNYRVSLELHVPRSEVNRNVGMFMTGLKFLSKDGRDVGSSQRSAMIHFSSSLVSTLSSLLDFLMLHWRWKQESEMLDITLFENFIDDSYHPSETAVITIYCGNLQVYSAKLRIEAVFTGIRYYMFYWPITSATLGILSNIFVGILLAVWLYFKFCSDSSEDMNLEESFEIEDIFASGVNGEDESVSTLSRENGENEVEQGSRADGRSAATSSFPAHRQFIQARRSRIVSSAPTQDLSGRVRPVSLTSRNARSTRDSCCQTEPHSSPAAMAQESKAKVE